jgi:hypothetical protein
MLAAGCASGQTTFATITGEVTDPNGAVVPNAAITATNVASNYRYPTQSNGVGEYTMGQLLAGEYTLEAKAPGFKDYFVAGITLAAGDIRRLDVKLELGAIGTRVEVNATTALIETETARISGAKDYHAMVSLPMNDYSPFTFMGLTAGVLLDGNYNPRINGSQSNQTNMTVDGVSVMDGLGGEIGPVTPLSEDVEEVRIDTANNSAEFAGMGQVTYVSRSAGNQVHGAGMDYYSTPAFKSRNPFSLVRPTGITHHLAFNIGGPIVLPKLYNGHDKTFIFLAIDRNQGSQSSSTLNPTVPLAPWRTGDFSGLLPGTIVKDPLTGNPFPGNIIPTSRLNATALTLQDMFYPLPNYGNTSVLQSQNFRLTERRAFDPTTYAEGRLDHRFSERFTFFVRYTWQRQHNRVFEGNLPAIGQRWQDRNTRGLAGSFIQTLRPNLVNEFRLGYAFNNNPYSGTVMGLPLVQKLGLVGLVDNLPNVPGIFTVAFSGLGLTGISQSAYNNPGYRNLPMELQDQVSWSRGHHTLKIGGQVQRVTYTNMTESTSLFGNASFSNRFTGYAYADFLLGIPTTVSRAPAAIPDEMIWWGYAAFITDDFKVTPRLTLNLGARYELNMPWQDSAGLLSAFDTKLGKIVVPDGSLQKVSPLMPTAYVGVVEASQTNGAWAGKSLFHADTNNIAPRIGLAYRPWGPDTVFRTGFGVYYDINPRYGSSAGVPFLVMEPSYTNPTTAPTVILPRVFPAGGVGGPGTISLPLASSSNMIQPYTLQYNFTIEHQRWNTGFRISYVGSGTRQSTYTSNFNQPLPNNLSFIAKASTVPFPQYPGISYVHNGAGYNYNALMLEIQRKFRGGFSYQASWTWARELGYASPENAYNEAREYGVATDVPKYRITSNFIYEAPFGKGKRYLSSAGRVVDLIVGGWQISSVFETNSGNYLTPSWTGSDPTGTTYTTSSTPASVTIRPNELSNPNLPSDQRSLSAWFNAAAFGAPQIGSFGSASRGVIKGPSQWELNSGIYKYFKLWERLRFRWDFTATNVLNHPNWGNPATNISTVAQVGVISGTAGSAVDWPGPRAMRMGLRVEW